MKILCISDIHGDQDSIVRARDYVIDNNIGHVIVMGDYSVGFKDPNENRIDAEFSLKVLKRDAKVYALPGNCDQRDIIGILDGHESNLHGKKVGIAGITVVGLGGSNKTPFDTPFELSEEDIYKTLKSLLKGAEPQKTIIVTHFPPRDTKCDRIPSGTHAGSTSLRKVIEEEQPMANVCSHIHESEGQKDRIGKTEIVNVGKLSHGNGVLIDTESLSLEHISIE